MCFEKYDILFSAFQQLSFKQIDNYTSTLSFFLAKNFLIIQSIETSRKIIWNKGLSKKTTCLPGRVAEWPCGRN